MSIKGKYEFTADGRSLPFVNPVIDPVDLYYTDTSFLTFTYYSDPKKVAAVVPSIFEIDDKPLVTVMFCKWGMSRNGEYREVMFYIKVTYKGEKYNYCMVAYVTNETALIAGRETLGYPKLIANVEFNPHTETTCGLITSKLERPPGFPLVYGIVRPTRFMGKAENLQMPEALPRIAIRSLPGEPPIADIVILSSEVVMADLWECTGKIGFTNISGADDFSCLPVIEHVKTIMTTNARIEMLRKNILRTPLE